MLFSSGLAPSAPSVMECWLATPPKAGKRLVEATTGNMNETGPIASGWVHLGEIFVIRAFECRRPIGAVRRIACRSSAAPI
jgi:hypothetical protein